MRQSLRNGPGEANNAIACATKRWIKSENNLMFLHSGRRAGELHNGRGGTPRLLEAVLELLELKGRYTHDPRMPTHIAGSTGFRTALSLKKFRW